MKNLENLYKKTFIWSWLLRLFHWTFVFSIATLILTGLYINSPLGITQVEVNPSFLMVTMRYLHFMAAYTFIASFLIRLYLLFFGNKYERFSDFLPVSKKNLQSLVKTIKFYLYLSRDYEHKHGHNVLAGTVYFIIFLLSLFMIFSGLFMLYPENSFITSMGSFIFGTVQMARFVHFLLSWIFILFILFHIYILVWNDIKFLEGLISSIFTGYKFFPTKEIKEDIKE